MDRRSILLWPAASVASNTTMCKIIGETKVNDLITAAGKRTLHYFAINQRIRNPMLRDLTPQEFRLIERFVLYPELRPTISLIIRDRLNLANVEVDVTFAYPRKAGVIDDVCKMSSKLIRLTRNKESIDPICIFKLGPVLTPGELLSWTKQLLKLTSTRHKNILLRVMHGDIFSNSRLNKFGLRDSSECPNCLEPIETIQHKIAECPKARETWNHLETIKEKLNLNRLTDHTIEGIVGLKDRLTNIELALQAEVILKLTSTSEIYCPRQLARAATMLVLNSEHLTIKLNERFKALKNE